MQYNNTIVYFSERITICCANLIIRHIIDKRNTVSLSFLCVNIICNLISHIYSATIVSSEPFCAVLLETKRYRQSDKNEVLR